MPTPYNWRTGRPAPLLPTRHVFEITERVGPSGEVESELNESDVGDAVAAARSEGLQGLVVCFLHAYQQPRHESQARDLIAARAPDLAVYCSHEIWPRMREYERAIISIINAYVAPRMEAYLGDLEHRLVQAGVPARPFITQSAGGIVSAKSAQRRPVDTLLSGPAAGVMGAVHAARRAEISDFITLDIGGTSADVAFVENGRPRISQSEHVADFPLLMPVIGVSSIGAGGGSVLSVDAAGVLRAGPASVGADPGPVCYGRGGSIPAVTDAFLVGGFLNPETFAGGRVPLSAEKAEAALRSLSQALGRDTAGTVEAVVQVTVSSIYAELSNLAAKQGVSPRDYALLPFGGAGPVLATRVAEELGIRRIVVPLAPGTLCSLGAVLADVSKPFIRSVSRPLDHSMEFLRERFAELSQEAGAWLASEAPDLVERRVELSADLRYLGQSYEIDVTLDPTWITQGDTQAIASAFHSQHRAQFAHADLTAPVEMVDLRLTIVGVTEKAVAQDSAVVAPRGAAAAASRPTVIGGRFVDTPIYRREGLHPGAAFTGPAVVEQVDTTIVVGSEWSARVHPSGALILERTAS
jgi:N-methylhydantoinase A